MGAEPFVPDKSPAGTHLALLSGDLQQQAPAGDAHADAAELKQHKDSNDSMREEILESIVTLVRASMLQYFGHINQRGGAREWGQDQSVNAGA